VQRTAQNSWDVAQLSQGGIIFKKQISSYQYKQLAPNLSQELLVVFLRKVKKLGAQETSNSVP
jgi:hypothetical protein